jgi:phosphoribosylanthranilate isomerase
MRPDGGVAVKVCGLTVPEEARACAELGVWAIGVVLAAESPRRVDAARAAEVMAAVPDGVARVGVFVAPPPAEVAAVAALAGLTHVQLHDGDPGEVRRATGLPVIEGVRVSGTDALRRARESAAELVLLDAAVPGRHGGTGRSFDWGLLELEPLGRPFALAGGLRPETVADAVMRLRPAAVDVSSGVESSPGRKDIALVRAFVAAVACAGTADSMGPPRARPPSSATGTRRARTP